MKTETTTLKFEELTVNDLGNREIARKNSTPAEQVLKIGLDKIVIREGFNVRQDYGDIDGLAYSILENGQAVPGKVDILADGTFLLTDGHRRYKALCVLADMGHDAAFFRAIVNSTKTTEEQRIFAMFTTQDNKPLASHEIAELFQRLINLGYKQADIAKKVGKTPAYVSQMLSFASDSPVIKNHVVNGDINVATVLKVQKAIPVQSERVDAINKAVEIKKTVEKESGATKAKSVTVYEVTGKKEENKQVDNVVELAAAIAEFYGLKDADLAPMINLIKSYL